MIADAYQAIRLPGEPKPITLCTFADATRVACIIDAMLQSAANGGVWTRVTVPA